jgi:hypothetical protein
VASARWIEALALNHPNVQFLTISEEGLVGGSVKSVSWTEAVSLLRKEAPIKMRLQDALSRAQRCCIDPKKNALWDESLARCLAACTDLQLELLWQEPVYEFYLEPLWNIWGPLLRDAVKGQDLELHQMLFFRNVLKRLS